MFSFKKGSLSVIRGFGEFFYLSFDDDIKGLLSSDFWIYLTESECIVKHFGLEFSSNCKILFGYGRESFGKEFLSTRGFKLEVLRVDLRD